MWRKLGNRFFLGFFLVDDEHDFILCMQITLDASCQQIDRKYDTCTVFAGVLFVHQPGANHAPRASVTQINHSFHTLSTFLRIRAHPSMQIFWISFIVALSDTFLTFSTIPFFTVPSAPIVIIIITILLLLLLLLLIIIIIIIISISISIISIA